MTLHLPAILADPPSATGALWLTNARVFDGTGAPATAAGGVLIEDGRIARVGAASDGVPEGTPTLDLAGRTLMPGLIDSHAHVRAALPEPDHGVEPPRPGMAGHVLAASLRRVLRMGITTVRNVGSYGDIVVEARQGMRYGAFRGPRVLTCGRIISATSPGGRFFDGMYREADGADDVRRAVREQLRDGADFIKVMTTGARSVEIEDPDPAQLTRAELAVIVGEAHRMGYRVAAHCEGTAGTELAIDEGVDTIEHGMYLNQRPDLLEKLAASDGVLVPTFGCFYGVAGFGERVDVSDGAAEPGGAAGLAPSTWTPMLVDLARYNLEQASKTLKAAHAAGVRLAMGMDWHPLDHAALELVRMIHHGLPTLTALAAATSGSAYALGLSDTVGRIAPGLLADLVVVDGDPVERPELLCERERIWLVLQLGTPIAGAALEVEPTSLLVRS